MLHKNEEEFKKTCADYFEMTRQYGCDVIRANLKGWLSETSEQGCGDDISLLMCYIDSDTEVARESEVKTNE